MTNMFKKSKYPYLKQYLIIDSAFVVCVNIFIYENIENEVLKVDVPKLLKDMHIQEYTYISGIRRLRLLGLIEDLIKIENGIHYYKINANKLLELNQRW